MHVFFGDAYISLNGGDDIYQVTTYHKGSKLKKGYAYIKGDYAYPYRGKYKPDESTVAGVYKSGDRAKFITSDDMDEYLLDNVIELDSSAIIERISTHKEQFVQPEDIEFINNNSEIYQPTIKEGDDFLKYLVKRIIIDKKINLRNYKQRFPNEYALNNMKSGLNRSTKMTVTNFRSWCEILGVGFEIRVFDTGVDKANPLEDDVVITSDDF